MGCDDDLVKCMVFWVNFFLALIGISILSVGIIYKITLEELSNVIPTEYQDIVILPVLIIPIGTSLIALALVGCYGSLTERIRFIAMHCIVLCFVFIVQVAIGIGAFYLVSDSEDFRNKLNVTLSRTFCNYYEPEDKGVVDLIQHQLACCGLNGSSYWEKVPRSCLDSATRTVHERDCGPLVLDYLTYCVRVIGVVTLILSLAELIGTSISLFFVTYLKGNARRFIFIKTYEVDNDIL